MKIAISTQSDTIESLIDQRFGRCKYFLLVELENNEIKEVKSVENQGAIQGHGAGIKAAQQIGELGVKKVITGSLGPNATKILNQLGIKSYHASGIANDALNKLVNDELNEIVEVSEPHKDQPKEVKTQNETKHETTNI